MLGGAVMVVVSIFGLYGAATGRLAAMLAAILAPSLLSKAPGAAPTGLKQVGKSNVYDILSPSGNPTKASAQGPYATQAEAQAAAKGNPLDTTRLINGQWYVVNTTAGVK